MPAPTFLNVLRSIPVAIPGVEFTVDSGRLNRSQDILKQHGADLRNAVAKAEAPDAVSWSVTVPGSARGGYLTAIHVVGGKLQVSCACVDWKTGGQSTRPQMPCKHILALAELVTVPDGLNINGIEIPAVDAVSAAPAMDWRDSISQAIQTAVENIAVRIQTILASGGVPLVIGPTGCGKTSAVRLVAQAMTNCLLVEHAGADSWTDSDVVGFVHANGERFPGPVARACAALAEGFDQALLFLDEFTRYNRRVQDGLMSFILPTPAPAAKTMGYAVDESIHRASAPFWGEAWAPVSTLKLVLACNPWGTELDPALVRRTDPLPIEFDEAVAQKLGDRLCQAVTASWRACADGSLPLPIEYQALAHSSGPDDLQVVAGYIRRLQVLDPGAAEGYLAVLSGMKIRPQDLGISR